MATDLPEGYDVIEASDGWHFSGPFTTRSKAYLSPKSAINAAWNSYTSIMEKHPFVAVFTKAEWAGIQFASSRYDWADSLYNQALVDTEHPRGVLVRFSPYGISRLYAAAKRDDGWLPLAPPSVVAGLTKIFNHLDK
jgi:hypothetical protein